MRSVKIKVFGKVQGVFYRVSTQRQAQKYGIKGWVKNCDDGTVEACFQGNESAIKALLDWCKKGPEYAIVECIQRSQINEKVYEQFTIR